MKTTRHGETRLRQRGFKESDVDLILETGTEIAPERIMLKQQDAEEAIQKRKREIAELERLKGTIVVIADGHLITAFHAAEKKQLTGASRPRRRRSP